MKNEIVATYALLFAVRTSDSCATVAATASPIARPMCFAEPTPTLDPMYVANAAHAATATMYVAAHGESSWNWLMAAGRRPLPRRNSLTLVPPSSGAALADSSGEAVAPDRVAPGGVAPDRLAPGGVAPRRVAPGGVAPRRCGGDRVGDVAPDHVAPDHVAPHDVAPDHVAPHDVAVGPRLAQLLRVGDGQCKRGLQPGVRVGGVGQRGGVRRAQLSQRACPRRDHRALDLPGGPRRVHRLQHRGETGGDAGRHRRAGHLAVTRRQAGYRLLAGENRAGGQRGLDVRAEGRDVGLADTVDGGAGVAERRRTG